MKLTKRRWRALMAELLEIRNNANTDHAFIENRLEELRQQLQAIERRLPPEPTSIPSCWTEPVAEVEGVSTTNVPEGKMAVLSMPTGELRWRTQNPDGTWRDCID